MKGRGVRDLMDEQRYRPSHLQVALSEKNIPGNWEGRSGLQNVYNLIDGKVMPRDGQVFIFLSAFLGKDIGFILKRYTEYEDVKTVGSNNEEIIW